jgi:hypothetical protein
MATKFQRTCNKLNKILDNRPENQKEFIDIINDIIEKEVFNKGGNLYWGRELFIDSNFDTEECRKKIHRNDVMFKDTRDPVEHPGITLCYKFEEV